MVCDNIARLATGRDGAAAMCLTTRSLLLHAFGELLVSVPDAVLEFTDSFEDEEFSDVMCCLSFIKS